MRGFKIAHCQLSLVDMFLTSETLKLLVDLAQIVAAFFTAAAVLVSLYLARRSEAQRLRLFIGMDVMMAVGPVPRTGPATLSHSVRLTAVNAGVLPVTVSTGNFLVTLRGGDAWTYGLTARQPHGQNKKFPLVLQHGEEVSFVIPIEQLAGAWEKWSPFLGTIRRPRFIVTTTLGMKHIRVPFMLLREINVRCVAYNEEAPITAAAAKKEWMRAAMKEIMETFEKNADQAE